MKPLERQASSTAQYYNVDAELEVTSKTKWYRWAWQSGTISRLVSTSTPETNLMYGNKICASSTLIVPSDLPYTRLHCHMLNMLLVRVEMWRGRKSGGERRPTLSDGGKRVEADTELMIPRAVSVQAVVVNCITPRVSSDTSDNQHCSALIIKGIISNVKIGMVDSTDGNHA